MVNTFLLVLILKNMELFFKNGRFSGRIWPDWGNTAWADMAGLGSKGLKPGELGTIALKNLEPKICSKR